MFIEMAHKSNSGPREPEMADFILDTHNSSMINLGKHIYGENTDKHMKMLVQLVHPRYTMCP